MSNIGQFYKQKNLFELKSKISSNQYLTAEQKELIEQVINESEIDLEEKLRLFPKTQAKIMARGNQQDAQSYNYSMNLDKNSINPEDRESIPAQKKARGRHARAAERYGRIARGEHPFKKSPNDSPSKWTNEEFDLLVDYLLDEGYTVDDIDNMDVQDLMELSPKLLQRASQRATIKSIALKKKDPKAAEKANRQREKFRTAAQNERDKQELKSSISKMSDAQKRALKRKMSEEFSNDEMQEALINHGYSKTTVKYMNGAMLEQAFFQLMEAKNTSAKQKKWNNAIMKLFGDGVDFDNMGVSNEPNGIEYFVTIMNVEPSEVDKKVEQLAKQLKLNVKQEYTGGYKAGGKNFFDIYMTEK